MSASQIFALAVAAVAVLAALAIFTVAFRRSDDERRTGSLPRRDIVADRRRRGKGRRTPAAATTAAGDSAVAVLEEPVPDPLQLRPALSENEMGVTRRSFFTRGVLATFGIFLVQFALGGLAFIWPRLKKGSFGSPIAVGDVNEIKAQLINPDGTIAPLFVPSAQTYIVPFEADITKTEFAGKGVVAEGVMALWQRCVHLGCRVPRCDSSQGFECPCHGSKYNYHGEYEAGPAPRNMDRFVVSIDDSNRLIVDTGSVVQTARSRNKTLAYPQGPSCLA